MSKNAIINQQNDYDIQKSLLEDEILLEVGNLEKLKEEQSVLLQIILQVLVAFLIAMLLIKLLDLCDTVILLIFRF